MSEEMDEAGKKEYVALLLAHRSSLVAERYKAFAAFDKAVMTLSGGALAVSFAFLKEVLAGKEAVQKGWLLAAWVCWTASIAVILSSIYMGSEALKEAIERIDEKQPDEAHKGELTLAVRSLNRAGMALFVVGAILMTIFAGLNF